MTTKGTLVDVIRNPRNGPNLSVMCMSAKLEVDVLAFSLLQMVRLVVKQDAELLAVSPLHQHSQRVAVLIGAVVASNDAKVAHDDTGILQQLNACVLVELTGARLATIVFVVADAGIDGSLQSTELLVHPFVYQGSHTAVNDVSGYEYQVWLLVVDDVHPAVQLVATIMIADVQVAHHHQLYGFVHLLCRQLQFLAIFVPVMQIAIHEQHQHKDHYSPYRPPVIIK